MELTIPIKSPFSPFVASANYPNNSFAGSEEITLKYYFYCNHLVYENLQPSYYKGYTVLLYKPLPIEDSIDSEGFLIFKADIDSSINSISCQDIVERFYTFKIIYPKSALFDYWLIKSRYEITDYDEYYYIPIKKKNLK